MKTYHYCNKSSSLSWLLSFLVLLPRVSNAIKFLSQHNSSEKLSQKPSAISSSIAPASMIPVLPSSLSWLQPLKLLSSFPSAESMSPSVHSSTEILANPYLGPFNVPKNFLRHHHHLYPALIHRFVLARYPQGCHLKCYHRIFWEAISTICTNNLVNITHGVFEHKTITDSFDDTSNYSHYRAFHNEIYFKHQFHQIYQLYWQYQSLEKSGKQYPSFTSAINRTIYFQSSYTIIFWHIFNSSFLLPCQSPLAVVSSTPADTRPSSELSSPSPSFEPW